MRQGCPEADDPQERHVIRDAYRCGYRGDFAGLYGQRRRAGRAGGLRGAEAGLAYEVRDGEGLVQDMCAAGGGEKSRIFLHHAVVFPRD